MTSDTLKDRSKSTRDIVAAEVHNATDIGKEAVVSGAYLYPIQGIHYLLSHPHLSKPLRTPLVYTLLTSLAVTSTLFIFTYLPQAAIMCLFSGPLGFVTAVPLILGEAGAIVMFVSRIFWLAPALDNLFDEVLLRQGLTTLVEKGRVVDASNSSGSGKRLGKVLTKPLDRFSKEGLIRYLLSLPLNAIPVVGTVFFLFYNGLKGGPSHHARYFQLKGMPTSEKAAFIKKRRGSYTAFGAAALALNLIPGASVLFMFSTTVGAALWASDMEKKAGGDVDVSASDEASHQTVLSGDRVKIQ